MFYIFFKITNGCHSNVGLELSKDAFLSRFSIFIRIPGTTDITYTRQFNTLCFDWILKRIS